MCFLVCYACLYQLLKKVTHLYKKSFKTVYALYLKPGKSEKKYDFFSFFLDFPVFKLFTFISTLHLPVLKEISFFTAGYFFKKTVLISAQSNK